MRALTLLLPALLLTAACAKDKAPDAATDDVAEAGGGGMMAEGTQAAPPLEAGQAEAIFAGGCFWCMEKPFDKLDGVVETTSGYTGGHVDHPTYRQVGGKKTGHIEAIRVVYDPDTVSYARLLEVFWHNIDPLQSDGQFCDKGNVYRTAVFTDDAEEKALFESSKAGVAAELGGTVDTRLLPKATFWEAEDYHQDFYEKNPGHYAAYRMGCGRDRRLEELWGDKAGH